jgi:hypothetical protein
MIWAEFVPFSTMSGTIVPGRPATAKVGHHRREEEEKRCRSIRQGTRVGRTTHWPVHWALNLLLEVDYGRQKAQRAAAENEKPLGGRVQLWRLDVTCRQAPSTRDRVRSCVMHKEKHHRPRPDDRAHCFRGRTSGDQWPVTQLRWGGCGIRRGSGRVND